MDPCEDRMRSIRRDMKIIEVMLFIAAQFSIATLLLTVNLTIRG